MNQPHRETLIRDAITSHALGNKNWFDPIQTIIMGIVDNEKSSKEQIIAHWIEDCDKYKAESVKNEINKLLEKLEML